MCTNIFRTGVIAVLLVTGPPAAQGQCESKLLPSDGAGSDFAGAAVAIDGDVAIMGAASHDHNDGLGPVGGAWIFRWDGGTWVEEQELLAPDRAAELGRHFGSDVSIRGDRVLIGATDDDEIDAAAGAAYMFRWNGAEWLFEQKLFASDASRVDRFGSSVHLNGDLAVVGAINAETGGDNVGAAYVFRWDGATWLQEQKLVALDAQRQSHFGNAVDRDGPVIVVGARLDGRNAPNAGAAYVFRWDGAVWLQERKLLADVPSYTDEFGTSVAVHGNVIAVGCVRDDDLGLDSGSTFVYRWNGADWLTEQKLTASDGLWGDRFGCAVSIQTDELIVGAHGDDDFARNCGSVFVFRREDGTWTEVFKLHASDPGTDDGLGHAVAMSGQRLMAGAPHQDDNGVASGAAYVFDLVDCACPEDLDGSGTVDFDDLLDVLAAWGDAGGPADLDGSGTVDFGDLLLVLGAWGPCE